MRNIDINNYNKESWWSSHISWTPAVLFDASLHLHMRVCPCTRFSVSIKWKGQKMSISAQLDIVAMHWFITECVYVFPHRENISMYWTHKRQPFFWKIFVSLDEITEWVKLVTEYSTAEFLSKLVIVSQRGKSRSPTLSCRHVNHFMKYIVSSSYSITTANFGPYIREKQALLKWVLRFVG